MLISLIVEEFRLLKLYFCSMCQLMWVAIVMTGMIAKALIKSACLHLTGKIQEKGE